MFMKLMWWSPVVLLVESVPQLIAQLWLLEYATSDTIDGLFTLSIVCTGWHHFLLSDSLLLSYDIFCALVMGAIHLPDFFLWICGKEATRRISNTTRSTVVSQYSLRESVLPLPQSNTYSSSESSTSSRKSELATQRGLVKTHQQIFEVTAQRNFFSRRVEGFGQFFEIWSISSHIDVQIGRGLVRSMNMISLNKFLYECDILVRKCSFLTF